MTRSETRDAVVWVTLDRPGALNAIDEQTLGVFEAALDAVRADPGVKALVFAGEGDVFCVGLDIDLLGKAFADHAYFASVLQRLKAILLGIEALPVPAIAAVNGRTRAGGFELLLACDLVFATADAPIGDTHLAFGIVPGGGASVRAPRKIGDQRAKELLFTGGYIAGEEAARIGLALEALPDRDALHARVEALLAKLRPLSRSALAHTKAIMREAASLPVEQAVDVELEHFAAHLREDPKADEGYRAFVEKRAPKWD